MQPRIDPKASLKELENLIARIDLKLKQLREMKGFEEIKKGTQEMLERGIKELEKTRKEVITSIQRLSKVLKKK